MSNNSEQIDISYFTDIVKHGVVKHGSLSFGNKKVFENLDYVVFDYEKNKLNRKIISAQTYSNIKALQSAHESEVVLKHIIKANIATKRAKMSTIVTGTIAGENFAWVVRVGNNTMSGGTSIYFDDVKMSGIDYLDSLATGKQQVEELDDGTYRISRPNNLSYPVTVYCKRYIETRVGPEVKIYKPLEYHRITKPAVIKRNVFEFWENNRRRFIVILSHVSDEIGIVCDLTKYNRALFKSINPSNLNPFKEKTYNEI